MSDRVTFQTADEITIVGDWQPAATTYAAAILVHMMPETRKSWAAAQTAFAKRGIATLAIDLRGHGESLERADGVKFDYRQFTDEQHQGSIYDLTAAVAWIRERGVPLDRLFAVGASIGANLSLQLITEEPRMPGAVLISPSADYRGVDAFDDVDRIRTEQGLYVVSSEDDIQSFGDSRKLFEMAPTQEKVFVPYKNAGHGTAILSQDPAIADKMGEWMIGLL